MKGSWFQKVLFWIITLVVVRAFMNVAKKGAFSGAFGIILLTVAGFLFLTFVLMRVMFASADVSQEGGRPAPPQPAPFEEAAPSAPKTQPRPHANYKKIAADIGSEAELKEYERRDREELERLEREARK